MRGEILQTAQQVLLPSAAVRRHGGDDVADPAKQAARANPQSRCDDQPEDPAQEITVVKLSDPRDQRAQNRREPWILHLSHRHHLPDSHLAAPC